MTEPLVKVEDLGRAFGRVRAVDGLSFSLEPGQVCGFIGPNGAGKTTTMRILATLEVPDRGDARVGGHSVLSEPRAVLRKLGFMGDHFEAWPHLDVREYLDFIGRAQGLRGIERREAIRTLAGFCGLEELLARPAAKLSKGMGQRLHLAKTLLHDPAVLVLDEPTAGLDPRARIEFRELVRELAARGKAILVSSHILSELSEVCDEVLVIEAGRTVVSGRVDEIARTLHQGTPVRLRVLGGAEAAESWVLVQPHVDRLVRQDGTLTFGYSAGDEALADLLARAVGAGLHVVECARIEADLEQIFLKATEGRLQ